MFVGEIEPIGCRVFLRRLKVVGYGAIDDQVLEGFLVAAADQGRSAAAARREEERLWIPC